MHVPPGRIGCSVRRRSCNLEDVAIHIFTFSAKFRGGIAVLLALGCIACEGKHVDVSDAGTKPPSGEAGSQDLVSFIRMGDPAMSGQLPSGFYGIENSAWRWTAGKFSVILRTPAGASQNGAALSFAFSIPAGMIEKLKDVTLTGSIGGKPLPSTKYDKAGAQSYNADIPAYMLTGNSVKVDFALNKSIPPGTDRRELGVVANSVSLR